MDINKKYSRSYVKNGDDLSNTSILKKYLDELNSHEVNSPAELEDFISKSEEVFSLVNDSASRSYVNMTVNTSDKEAEGKYLHILQNITPLLEKASFDFSRKIVESEASKSLDEEKFFIYLRSLRTKIKTFKEDNIPLLVQDSKLSQKFQKIMGSWMVEFQGKEMTVQEASKVLFETDRAKREEVYKAIRTVKEKNLTEIENIYDKMVELRDSIAKNAGYKNYIEYAFDTKERFDYTADDCKKFHESILKHIVPLVDAHHRKRAKQMGIDKIKPWDLNVDSLGRPPLKPFEKTDELVSGCENIFNKIDEEFGKCFTYMKDNKLLDLDSRKGKAPGGYQTVFGETREPFIFMNAVGVPRDVTTLLHEGGHAFHSFSCRDIKLAAYRHAGHEFGEVASMSMELLARDFISEFYNDADRERFLDDQLQEVLNIFPWVAMLDAFQLWVYENPRTNRDDRWKKWIELEKAYRPYIDWDGYEVASQTGWHYVHPFQVPLYYVEYGIAQLGAVQVWLNSKKNFKSAVERYKSALALGGSQILPKLFEEAGAAFDMSESVIGPIVEELRKEIRD